ncbi:MAG: hypothetical protein QMB77_00995 [Aliarcobacter cryaerophilus]
MFIVVTLFGSLLEKTATKLISGFFEIESSTPLPKFPYPTIATLI